jgi:phthiocerol/phenolphthiocerol synthesis type-I polyketide synthase D
VPVDWRQYQQFYSALSQSPSLSEVASEEAVNLAASPRREHRKALLAAEPAARLQLVQAYLGEQVARVLGFSASRLDVDQPLSNLGLDSLMAVELKNRISVDLGVNLPMVKFLQGPSVAQAATQILEQLTAELSTSPVSLTPAVGDRDEKSKNGDDDADGKLLAKLDELSDDEVNSMLIDMLDKAEISQ